MILMILRQIKLILKWLTQFKDFIFIFSNTLRGSVSFSSWKILLHFVDVFLLIFNNWLSKFVSAFEMFLRNTPVDKANHNLTRDQT